jgi:hypothetical protein
MAQGSGFALSLGIILAVIAVAITMWAAPPMQESVSAAPTSAQDAIYRPQLWLVY